LGPHELYTYAPASVNFRCLCTLLCYTTQRFFSLCFSQRMSAFGCDNSGTAFVGFPTGDHLSRRFGDRAG